MLGVDDAEGDVAVLVAASVRISSVPMALVPLPNHVARVSSSARVLPGSMETVVDLALSPSGVKVSWYFCVCGAVLVTRTSDWKLELMPPAWATAGMMSASGGGVFFEPGATGCTRLTLTGVGVDVAFALRGVGGASRSRSGGAGSRRGRRSTRCWCRRGGRRYSR